MVELAVVLVIIALLIGGLATLNSYTRNAALSGMVNDARLYMDAFNRFQDRYGSPPGDFAKASSMWTEATSGGSSDGLTHNGDSNGIIRATGTATDNKSEYFYVFQHLALAGMIGGSYTGATSGGTAGTDFYAKIGTNVPGTSMDKVAFLFDHPDATDGIVNGDSFYYDGAYGNVLRVAGLYDTDTNIPSQVFLTPQQAQQIDEKFDDGKPGMGFITVPVPPASATTPLHNCASSTTASSATYNNSSSADKACYLILRMK